MRALTTIITVVLVLSGTLLEVAAHRSTERPAPVDPFATSVEPGPPTDKAFIIDVGALAPMLEAVPFEDRHHQLADWAVYGTLLQLDVPLDEFQQLTFDKAPVRLPALEEVINFEFDEGRRLVRSDGELWLFRSRHVKDPIAVLGRLADRARMDMGALPKRVRHYVYRSALEEGAIHVERAPDIPVSDLFGPEYGYVDANVRNRAQFEAWIAAVDDVTFAKKRGRTLQLGGRQFADTRTMRATAEDVAALYQAHRSLDQRQARIQEELKKPVKPALDAFDAAIDGFNTAVRRFNSNNSASLDLDRIRADLRRTEAAMRDDTNAGASVLDDSGPTFGGLGAHANKSAMDTLEWQIAKLKARLEPWVKTQQAAALKRVYLSGEVPPGDPGFSLDPGWDLEALGADLKALLKSPAKIAARARKVAEAGQALEALDASTSHIRLAEEAALVPRTFSVPKRYAPKIAALAKAVSTADRRNGDEALVPLFELFEVLKADEAMDAAYLHALLDFVKAAHESQCARYDGPLRGTRVGMVLFYTDVLAKIWAAVDYYGSAPVDEIPGFRSGPRVGPTLEPAFWAETWAFPSTRLWFGPRPEAISEGQDGDSVRFAHIGARVYSAGSNPLKPGEEGTAAERSRRVFNWWDRHFAAVADHEQRFHVQNQIMKWSVITGWLADTQHSTFLDDIPVTTDRRFDRWMSETKDLRFSKDLRFTAPTSWKDGRECMRRLTSRSFFGSGEMGYISGGVSLGSKLTLKGSRISKTVGQGLRRGGLDYKDVTGSVLKMRTDSAVRGAKYAIVDGKPTHKFVKITPGDGSRLRASSYALNTDAVTVSHRINEGRRSTLIATDTGTIGRLEAQRTKNGVKLGWAAGGTTSRLRQVHNAAKARTARRIPDRVATHPDSLVLQNREGLAIIKPAGSGRAEVIAAAPSVKRGVESKWLTAMRGDAKPMIESATSRFRQGRFAAELGIENPITRAQLIQTGRTRALKPINDAPWQRLTPRESTGFPKRVFTDEAPLGGRTVQVKTGDPTLPTVEARLVDGEVWLKRPADAALNANFNTLGTSQAFTPDRLRTLLKAPEAPLPAVRANVQRTARAVDRGDPLSVIRDLGRAKDGQLTERAAALVDQVSRRRHAHLASGRSSQAAQRFLAKTGDPAEARLNQALESLSRRDLDGTAKAVEAVLTAKNPGTSRALAKALEARGEGAMTRFVRTQSADFAQAHANLSRRLTLRPDRYAMHLDLDIARAGFKQTPVKQAEQTIQAIARDGRGQVFVDRRLLGQYDWDGLPGASLSSAQLRKTTLLVELRTGAGAAAHPTRIVDSRRQWVRKPMAPKPAERLPITALRYSDSQPATCQDEDDCPIYLLTQCDDPDGDGSLSDDERQRCLDAA